MWIAASKNIRHSSHLRDDFFFNLAVSTTLINWQKVLYESWYRIQWTGTFSNMYRSALQVFFIIQWFKLYNLHVHTAYFFHLCDQDLSTNDMESSLFRFWPLSHVILNQIQIWMRPRPELACHPYQNSMWLSCLSRSLFISKKQPSPSWNFGWNLIHNSITPDSDSASTHSFAELAPGATQRHVTSTHILLLFILLFNICYNIMFCTHRSHEWAVTSSLWNFIPKDWNRWVDSSELGLLRNLYCDEPPATINGICRSIVRKHVTSVVLSAGCDTFNL